MRFYTASKTKHASKWKALRATGHKVTATWIDEAGEGQTADYVELSERCQREIASSDFVLLYCEPGETLKGALVEAGMALALGKPVRCVGDCDSLSRVFNEHTLWSRHATIDDALRREATDEMIDAACAAVPDLYRVDAMRAIEAALAVG